MGNIIVSYLLKCFALFCFSAMIVAITTGFIFLDILVLNNGISETSATELGQELIGYIMSSFLYTFINSQNERGIHTDYGLFSCVS